MRPHPHTRNHAHSRTRRYTRKWQDAWRLNLNAVRLLQLLFAAMMVGALLWVLFGFSFFFLGGWRADGQNDGRIVFVSAAVIVGVTSACCGRPGSTDAVVPTASVLRSRALSLMRYADLETRPQPPAIVSAPLLQQNHRERNCTPEALNPPPLTRPRSRTCTRAPPTSCSASSTSPTLAGWVGAAGVHTPLLHTLTCLHFALWHASVVGRVVIVYRMGQCLGEGRWCFHGCGVYLLQAIWPSAYAVLKGCESHGWFGVMAACHPYLAHPYLTRTAHVYRPRSHSRAYWRTAGETVRTRTRSRYCAPSRCGRIFYCVLAVFPCPFYGIYTHGAQGGMEHPDCACSFEVSEIYLAGAVSLPFPLLCFRLRCQPRHY